MDTNGKVRRLYGCHSIPIVIVIGRQGAVTAPYFGEHDENDLKAALRAAGARPE